MASLRSDRNFAIRLIYMSVSGGGKTSSCLPLAIPNIIPGWPGRKLFVLNFDGADKFEELAVKQLSARLAGKGGLTKITKEQYDAALANIQFEDCIDYSKVRRNGKSDLVAEILAADAWPKARKTLDSWYPKLDQDSVLIIDSFTHLSKAIAHYTMDMANRLNAPPAYYVDYAPAQAEIAKAMSVLGSLSCSLIVTAHQDVLEVKKFSETAEKDDETGEMVFKEKVIDTLMLPQSFGRAGRIEIPSTFNHLLFLAVNKNQVREIRLEPGKGIVPKSPFFAIAQKAYGLDKGLVEYFSLGVVK